MVQDESRGLTPNDTNTYVNVTGRHGGFQLIFYIPQPLTTFRKIVTLKVCVRNSSALAKVVCMCQTKEEASDFSLINITFNAS